MFGNVPDLPYICIISNALNNNKKLSIMKALTLDEIANIKFKTVLTYTGCEVAGYMNEKTIEFGNWIISRDGEYNKEGVYVHWAGEWNVSKGEKIYSSTKTLKAAKAYIKLFLEYNPTDY